MYKYFLYMFISFFLFHGDSFAQSCTDGTTDDIEKCRSFQLKESEENLNKYIIAASKRLEKDNKQKSLEKFNYSQKLWYKYRDNECNAVELFFQPGTISYLMKIDCLHRLTDLHTHEVWSNWLRYLDSTPPILPEPHL